MAAGAKGPVCAIATPIFTGSAARAASGARSAAPIAKISAVVVRLIVEVPLVNADKVDSEKRFLKASSLCLRAKDLSNLHAMLTPAGSACRSSSCTHQLSDKAGARTRSAEGMIAPVGVLAAARANCV